MPRLARPFVLGAAVLALLLVTVWWASLPPDRGLTDATRETSTVDEGPLLRGGAAPPGPTKPSPPGTAAEVELTAWPIGVAPEQREGTGRVYVLLVDRRGRPLPNHPIEVNWWKAFAVHGDEGGVTDERGRFRTSAEEPWHLDSVSLPTAENASHLYHAGPFAPSPDRPDEVRVVVPAAGWIRGRVLDSAGRGVAGVRVQAEDLRSLPPDPFAHPMHYSGAETVTDASGAFSMHAVLGRHHLRLDPSIRAVSEFRVQLTARRPVVDVVLRTVEPLRGRTVCVTLDARAPEGTRVGALADAEPHRPDASTAGVEAIVKRARRTGRRLDERTFEVDGIEGNGWQVVVSAPGPHGRAFSRHDLPDGATEIALPLPDPLLAPTAAGHATVRIVARTPDGTTVAPEVHVLRAYDLGELDGPWDHQRTAGETHVQLSPHDDKVYLVVGEGAYARVGIGPLRAATAPERVEVDLAISDPATVEVVDPAGRPAAAEITLQPAYAFFHAAVEGRLAEPTTMRGFHGSTWGPSRIITGDEGRAHVDRLGGVPWQVTAQPTDATLPAARGVLRAGDHVRLVLGTGYPEGEVFRGRVVDFVHRRPLADIRIVAVTDDTDEGHASATARTAADGTFTVRGLPARRTRFRVYGHGWAFPRNAALDLGAERGTLVFALHAARRLPILVVDGAGRPLPDMTVSHTWLDGTPLWTQDQYGNMGDDAELTDLGGRVDLLGLPATRVVLHVRGPGEPEATRSRFEVDLTEPVQELLTLRHAVRGADGVRTPR